MSRVARSKSFSPKLRPASLFKIRPLFPGLHPGLFFLYFRTFQTILLEVINSNHSAGRYLGGHFVRFSRCQSCNVCFEKAKYKIKKRPGWLIEVQNTSKFDSRLSEWVRWVSLNFSDKFFVTQKLVPVKSGRTQKSETRQKGPFSHFGSLLQMS